LGCQQGFARILERQGFANPSDWIESFGLLGFRVSACADIFFVGRVAHGILDLESIGPNVRARGLCVEFHAFPHMRRVDRDRREASAVAFLRSEAPAEEIIPSNGSRTWH
jgi:hypothetical protein